MLLFEVGDTIVPINLMLTQNGVPMVGETVTAGVRRKSDNLFLDFADNTFKASGHTTKFQALTDLNGTDADLAGHYAFLWNSATAITGQGEFEFVFKHGTSRYFDDVYFLTPVATSVWSAAQASFVAAGSFGRRMKEIRAALLNRQEIADGSSGNFVTYDDDGTTPLVTNNMQDKTGAAIGISAGVPARRGVPS
jgi:hypothetical protein